MPSVQTRKKWYSKNALTSVSIWGIHTVSYLLRECLDLRLGQYCTVFGTGPIQAPHRPHTGPIQAPYRPHTGHAHRPNSSVPFSQGRRVHVGRFSWTIVIWAVTGQPGIACFPQVTQSTQGQRDQWNNMLHNHTDIFNIHFFKHSPANSLS